MTSSVKTVLYLGIGYFYIRELWAQYKAKKKDASAGYQEKLKAEALGEFNGHPPELLLPFQRATSKSSS